MIYEISDSNIEKIRKMLESKGKKILFYHQDSDGVCSAALLLKFFHDFRYLTREGPMIESSLIEKLLNEKPDIIFFIDLPVDQEWKQIKKLTDLKNTKIFILDHHIYEKNMNSKNILHINPRFDNKDLYIPSSCLVFDMLEKLGKDVKKHMWIAGIGVIGDFGIRDCKKLLDTCKKLYPDLISGNILNSKLALGSELISAAITFHGLNGAKKALKIMINSENYDQFSDNEKLKRWHYFVRSEIDNILDDFETRKEEYPKLDLIIYEIKSRFNIASVISSIIALRYPEKIVIIKKKSINGWKLSARYQRQGKINLGNLIKNCTKNIGSGGGHENAAGALIYDWRKFKERILRKLTRISSSH